MRSSSLLVDVVKKHLGELIVEAFRGEDAQREFSCRGDFRVYLSHIKLFGAEHNLYFLHVERSFTYWIESLNFGVDVVLGLRNGYSNSFSGFKLEVEFETEKEVRVGEELRDLDVDNLVNVYPKKFVNLEVELSQTLQINVRTQPMLDFTPYKVRVNYFDDLISSVIEDSFLRVGKVREEVLRAINVDVKPILNAVKHALNFTSICLNKFCGGTTSEDVLSSFLSLLVRVCGYEYTVNVLRRRVTDSHTYIYITKTLTDFVDTLSEALYDSDDNDNVECSVTYVFCSVWRYGLGEVALLTYVTGGNGVDSVNRLIDEVKKLHTLLALSS